MAFVLSEVQRANGGDADEHEEGSDKDVDDQQVLLGDHFRGLQDYRQDLSGQNFNGLGLGVEDESRENWTPTDSCFL